MEIDHPILGNYEIIKKIGEGSFATVYLARHSVLHYLVAIKIFQEMNRKDKIHKSIIHPFICQDYDLLKMPNGENCIIMEYVEGETLLDYANHHPLLSEEKIRNIFGQLVIAIDYLHKNNMIHRDLKCENVMIDKNQNIRLIDLDFSCQNIDSHSTMCGSPGYIAPEMLSNQKGYGNSIDIWALGVIIYAISYGILPFDNRNISHMIQMVLSSEPDFPEDKRISSNLIYIIKKMLIKNPDQRITINEIKKDPFFTFDSLNNEFIFKETKIDHLTLDLISKINPEKSIFNQMHLTLKETADATNEILNRQTTYNSMTYSILMKQFGSSFKMSYNSINFLYPIKKICNTNMSESNLPLMIDDPSLTNTLMTSSSLFQLPDLNIEKTGATKYKFNIITARKPDSTKLLVNRELRFRHFNSTINRNPISNLINIKKPTFSSQLINQITISNNKNKETKEKFNSTFTLQQL